MVNKLNLWRTVVAVLGLTMIAGCGGRDYEVAEVDGVLLIKGQPGHKVHIEFVPDIGVNGPRSVADTDAQGKFALRLALRDGSAPAGAVVGSHKVVLSDIQLSESATGQGIRIRFGPEYTIASSTPLKQEVKSGRHTLRLQIP